jgi:hypothetical protein
MVDESIFSVSGDKVPIARKALGIGPAPPAAITLLLAAPVADAATLRSRPIHFAS